VHQSIRERESLESVRRLSSGEKQNTGDGGDISFAAGLASRTNTERVAKDNLNNAIVSRMSDLAYKAADFMSTSSERSQLDREFQELSETLKAISNEKQADQVLFDPMASKYITEISLPPPAGGTSEKDVSEPFDIEAYRGTVKLWWHPMTARDRVQLMLGDVAFFDSGEYVSKYDGSYRQDMVNGETRIDDYFEIDFGPTESEIRPGTDSKPNKGGRATTWKNASGVDLSSSLPNYPRGQATDGKSSILTTIRQRSTLQRS
jgi:hypothetical protein